MTEIDYRNCEHCGGLIHPGLNDADWLHSDGIQVGLHTCAVAPYGFHAHPVGTPCPDHPANPCNGALGRTVRPPEPPAAHAHAIAVSVAEQEHQAAMRHRSRELAVQRGHLRRN